MFVQAWRWIMSGHRILQVTLSPALVHPSLGLSHLQHYRPAFVCTSSIQLLSPSSFAVFYCSISPLPSPVLPSPTSNKRSSSVVLLVPFHFLNRVRSPLTSKSFSQMASNIPINGVKISRAYHSFLSTLFYTHPNMVAMCYNRCFHPVIFRRSTLPFIFPAHLHVTFS